MVNRQSAFGIAFGTFLFLVVSCLAFAQSASTAADKAAACFYEQKWAEAATAYEELTKSDPKNPHNWYRLAYSYHSLGKYDLAVSNYMNALQYGQSPAIMYNLACSYARLGKKDEAIDWLNKAVKAGFAQVNQITSDPDLASLHDDQRFEELAAEANKLAKPCSNLPEYKQFDFWIGEWDVQPRVNPQGPPAASSIQRIVDGCIIFENYTQPGGYSGKSINFFDRIMGKWRQVWVDNAGNVAEFNGVSKDGGISYEGESKLADGSRLLRTMIFTPMGDEKVRQYSEVSTDGGKTWSVAYDLIYTRKKAAE